ncbi:MAG: polymer-forming cytoskeletal protein [bacterium]
MEEAKTIITDDVEITGSIKCTSSVKLAGKLNGDLSTTGDVSVEKGAAIKGNVIASSIVVQGMIKGNITAKERIELKGNARVSGDIKAKRLVVEEGVSLVGKSEITPVDSVSGELPGDIDTPVVGVDEAAKTDDDGLKAAIPSRPAMDPRARTGQLFARK